MDYKKAGVDTEAGDALVDWLSAEEEKKSLKIPHQERILSGIGGFASLFRVDFPEMKKPCLVTCTDGVGTKVKLASHFQKYAGVGQDLVAMCVNDLICTGGSPLLFLDYYATGKLELSNAKEFLSGVKEACHKSDCALVGGETAEMPGVYHDGDFDCAGFAVGVVDEDRRLGPHLVQKGDVLIGVSSSGFHSNGYSLLRKVFENDLDQWEEKLLTPTALYVQLMKDILKKCKVHAAAHITGGGLENVPRVLPENLKPSYKTWIWPDEFREVQKRTGMSDEKMMNTLNCGLGFVIVAPENQKNEIVQIIEKHQFKFIDVGLVN